MALFLEKVKEILPGLSLCREEPMKKHTSFRIGGPAEYYARPAAGEIAALLGAARECQVPVTVIGNGSNLLVSDAGIRGLVVEIGDGMSEIRVETGGAGAGERRVEIGSVDVGESRVETGGADAGESHVRTGRIIAGAGALLSRVANVAADAGLGGMEFAAGIPGSIGGAVTMNAGAYGGEMKDILETATVLSPGGEIRQLSVGELDLSYRHSCIPSGEYIVLEAVIALAPREQEEIRAQMAQLRQKRMEKQPLEYPSAGSTFKRPEGYFAGKLIMDAGLRGYTVGGAQVSEKHCGFVVNRGGATAADVRQLMQDVQDRVQEKFGVRLEPEVKMVGEFQ